MLDPISYGSCSCLIHEIEQNFFCFSLIYYYHYFILFFFCTSCLNNKYRSYSFKYFTTTFISRLYHSTRFSSRTCCAMNKNHINVFFFRHITMFNPCRCIVLLKKKSFSSFICCNSHVRSMIDFFLPFSLVILLANIPGGDIDDRIFQSLEKKYTYFFY